MKIRKPKNAVRRITASIFSGMLNGLLGTGGGIPLYFMLSKEGADKRAYATASVGVLLLSLQTVLLYRKSAIPLESTAPLLPFLAVLGGSIGALLLGKVNTRLLRLLLGLLLLFSGIYTIGKEFHLVFS